MHIIFSTTSVIDGISLYWNDNKLEVEEYNGKQKKYVCGRKLLKFESFKTLMYSILVVDYDDCCCADVYSDGEIKVHFELHSEVPHKHKKGGQSAKRFARIRENEITIWFKRINEYLKIVNSELYLGISPIYQRRFIKSLSTYNLQKIKTISNTEYSDLCGIYQFVNKLEAAKNQKI